MLKKLAGDAKKLPPGSPTGNEYCAILQSVVTSSGANKSLQPMDKGLVERYATANVPSPQLLYTDRDCCSLNGM